MTVGLSASRRQDQVEETHSRVDDGTSLPVDATTEVLNDTLSEGDRGSLYRAYRSLTFDEVVGQRHVTQTLRNAVRYGKVAHAYLFTGPRGTGKTSTARILARAVNCLQPRDGEPCNHCAVCVSMLQRRSLDLVEIDGASNNSVDDVRELRDRVNLRPAEGRRKVFIIDEVHMLSIGAFNALLKTLEEPPEHVLFALATTELHKVPATVRSRCQLLELHPIAAPEMADRLRHVCSCEGIDAGDDVIRLITSQSTGSLRDALSLLEQIRAFCGDSLVLVDVEAALGVAHNTHVVALAGAMAAGNLAQALLVASDLLDGGVDARQLNRQLTGYWRDALVARARQRPVDEPNVAQCRAEQIVPVLYALLTVESGARRSDSPRWALETAIAEATIGLAGPQESLASTHESVQQAPASRADDPRASHVPAAPYRAAHAPPPDTSAAAEHMAETHSRSDIAPDLERQVAYRPSRREERAEPQAKPAESMAPQSVDPVSQARTSSTSDSGLSDTDARTPAVHERAEQLVEAEIGAQPDPRARWPMVVRRLHESNKPQVYNLLQKVIVDLIRAKDSVLELPFRPGDSFYRERLETAGNRKVIEDAVSDTLGGQWGVRCVTIDEPTVRRGDIVDLEYLEQMAAEAKVLGGEREHEI